MVLRDSTVVENGVASGARPHSPTTSIHSCGTGSMEQSSRNSKTKLPKITLPKFNGDFTKFYTFWESFARMVNTNEDLSSINKFNYLSRSLEGATSRAIEGLPMRDRTYQSAIDLLKERFGNKQKIISSHMDRLIKIKAACESEGIAQLRLVYDQINIQIRGLEALGVTSDTYGSLLIPIIMSGLPSQISLQIARHTTKDVLSLSEVLELLRKEVEARELNQDATVNIKEKQRATGNYHQYKLSLTPTSLTLHT